jgi:sulfur-oxidizing protein SoxX
MLNNMKTLQKKLTLKATLTGLMLTLCSAHVIAGTDEGKKIAFDRKKGNCLACHMTGDGEMPGNVGPPLIAMKARFPDRAVLKEQIWNPTIRNQISIMPPFGKHYILTDSEIEKLIDYLYTL